jgi:replicative DNA helicase
MAKASSRNPFDVSHLVWEAAERQVLAGVLVNLDLDPVAARSLIDELPVEMFHGDITTPLYALISESVKAVADPSRADVVAALHRAGHVQGDEVHSLFVDIVTDYAGMEPQALRLARQAAPEVRENHERRHAIHAAELVARSGGRPDDLAVMVQQLERVRDAGGGPAGVITFDQCVDDFQNAQDDAVIPTGFRLFDDVTDGGLPVGELTGLCAPPGAGKSALALQLLIGAMIQDADLRALWCLGEMTPKILVRRAACVGTAILGEGGLTMRDAKRRTDEARNAADSMRKLLGGGRFSVLKPALTVDRIAAAISVTKPKVVVIDYLQLMTGPGADRIGEMEATVAQLTALAITTETAIVVVSSMSKAAIGGGAKIGTIGKGTGQIDYAMSFVFLGEPDDEARQAGAATFDVLWRCEKARNEDRRSFTARFDGARQFYSQAIDPIEEFANFGIGGGARER